MGARVEHRIIDGVEHKWCSKHDGGQGRWLLLDSFHKFSDAWDHLCRCCRACWSIMTGYKPTGVRHYPYRLVDGIEQKYCSKDKHWLTLDNFGRNSMAGDTCGLNHWCKECVAKASREWVEDNPEKVAANSSLRRAREVEAEGKFTGVEFMALCEYYDNQCLCPDTDHAGSLVPDHVVPLSRGGSNDISNIQPLCAHHNGVKHARTIDYREATSA